MKPSQFHPNRKSHNWLAYDIGDRFLKRYTKFYRGTLYDFGCGEKPYANFFLQYVEKYIGVDWSNTIHNLNSDLIADLNKPLPIKSEIADTIICLSVLEHLSEPQVMLNEAFRILKPRGIMLLQVPWQWWLHEAPYDFYRYTPYGLKYMLEKAGFIDLKIEPESGFFTTLVLKCNYFSMNFIRGPRLIKWIVQGVLMPFWFFGQVIAPRLDKFDKNWALETTGYNVIAKKGH